jgi:predicted CXXCH cytochrome family protein
MTKFVAAWLVIFVVSCAMAQNTDVLGMHNLSPSSGSPVYSGGSLGCTFCHAPHSNRTGGNGLWNQQLSAQTYTPYTSSTYSGIYHQKGNTQPPLGMSSSLCLSCHDGTVAPGQGSIYGQQTNKASMFSADVFGADLSTSHPFSMVLPLSDAPDLAASLVASKRTIDPLHKVRLIAGNVECTSCHNPHVQAIDTKSQNFLVRDSSSGQMCLSCHDPLRVVTGQVNQLTGWSSSMHATATNPIMSSANLGSYGMVAATACLSCHVPHKAGGAARILRIAVPALPSIDPIADPTTQPCLTCHAGGSNLQVAAPNVYIEISKASGHPYPAGPNLHDAAESVATTSALLNNNRHATCVDCHNPHDANTVGTVFPVPPAIRVSQSGVVGVSASDGTTVLTPAVNQFENCLRCHGTSTGKQILAKYGYLPTRVVSAADSLNVIPQLSPAATSSHPVTHDSSSTLVQFSLRTYMMKFDGTTQARLIGQRIFCTDCHNSDDNREFSVSGGGPNGPHGSIYSHILERRYEFSQAATSGQTITNLFPNPDLTATGPYALCAKCHDLTNVVTDVSFSKHSLHINAGFSCSVCHSAHGMGSVSTTVSGERLVNFDASVVAQNGTTPITYSHTASATSNNTCILQCHGYNHNADGSVSAAALRSIRGKAK